MMYLGFINDICNSIESFKRYTGVTALLMAFLNSSLEHYGTMFKEKA